MKKTTILFPLIILNILISPFFVNSVSAEVNTHQENIISELMAQIVQMENVLKKYNLSLENQEKNSSNTLNNEIEPELEEESNNSDKKENTETKILNTSSEENMVVEDKKNVFSFNCLKINRVMRPEDYRDDIIKLQEFLKERGHFHHPHITKYFGPVTKKAVQDFQIAEGIVSHGTPQTTGFGQVGPLTAKKIKEITCSTTDNNSSDI